MNRDATLLENVKFLTLSNKSHTESSLNPRNFEIVNAVIRELEVDVLIHRSPAAMLPAVSVLHSVEPAVDHDPERSSLIEARTCNTKIPFLACLQYESLEDGKNMIQKLIQSMVNSEFCASGKRFGSTAESVDNIDVEQCQLLAELSEWRLEMVRELSNFGPPNTAFTKEDNEGGRMYTD